MKGFYKIFIFFQVCLVLVGGVFLSLFIFEQFSEKVKFEEVADLVDVYQYTTGLQEYDYGRDTGLIILLGQLHLDPNSRDSEIFKEIKEIRKTFEEAKSADILFIGMHNSGLSKDQIVNSIKSFSEKHKSVMLVSGVHGNVVFPWEDHKVFFKPLKAEKNIPVMGHLANLFPKTADHILNKIGVPQEMAWPYFSGQMVETKEYLSLLVDAIGPKLNVLWQASCQGSQTIDEAMEIISPKVLYISESEGANIYPGVLIRSLSAILKSNNFSLEDLLKQYAFEANIEGDKQKGEAFLANIAPVISGREFGSIMLTEIADKINDQLDPSMIDAAIKKYCDPIGVDENCFSNLRANVATASKRVSSIKKAKFADCTGLYYSQFFFSQLLPMEQKAPENCNLSTKDYLASLIIGALNLDTLSNDVDLKAY